MFEPQSSSHIEVSPLVDMPSYPVRTPCAVMPSPQQHPRMYVCHPCPLVLPGHSWHCIAWDQRAVNTGRIKSQVACRLHGACVLFLCVPGVDSQLYIPSILTSILFCTLPSHCIFTSSVYPQSSVADLSWSVALDMNSAMTITFSCYN